MRATAQQILDGPFQFLLNARGFHARSLEHESDLFSAWGRILLVQNQSGKMSQAQIERLFVRAAKAKGWTITNDLPDIGDEARNGFGNLGESKEIKFEMVRRSHAQNPPTRYSCKVWVARDGTQVLAAFRVDAE